MGMTMTQKILAAHAGLPEVRAGQLIEADLDLVLGNDIRISDFLRGSTGGEHLPRGQRAIHQPAGHQQGRRQARGKPGGNALHAQLA